MRFRRRFRRSFRGRGRRSYGRRGRSRLRRMRIGFRY